MTTYIYILLITILAVNITMLTVQQKDRETYKDYIKTSPAYGMTEIANQCKL